MTTTDTLRAAARGEFVVRDSGARQQFEGGIQRDTDEGKPRFDLIPPAPLRRVAEHYAKGAAKYDDHNGALGQPLSRLQASAERHLQAWKCREGNRTENAGPHQNSLSHVVTPALTNSHLQGSGREQSDLTWACAP